MKKVLRFLFAILGALLALSLLAFLTFFELITFNNKVIKVVSFVGFFLFGFFLMFYFSNSWSDKIIEALNRFEMRVEKLPISDLLLGTLGLIIGVFIAFLISQTVSKLEAPIIGNILGIVLSIIIYIIFGFLGIKLATLNKNEIKGMLNFKKRKVNKLDKEEDEVENVFSNVDKIKSKKVPKILDTSVIIDGRIKDIIHTGFLEGPLIIPNFVLEELQNIADSSDSIRRERGRRGLDIVKTIKEREDIGVIIDNTDYPEISQVDMKLLKMTKAYEGKIITNDYNLNKVALLQEIEVLNVNELAIAIKTIVYPGETLSINILKEGKGKNQGLGYLEDGTMVVVENGVKYIGKNVETVVTSVIQTAAGKMIFVKIN